MNITDKIEKIIEELEKEKGTKQDITWHQIAIRLAQNTTKSLTADELIKSLGTPELENEYILKPDKDGTWWIEHKHVGSGEPLKQWLTNRGIWETYPEDPAPQSLPT